jgi:hypothetical protein
LKKFFHNLFERREQAGVVGGDTPLEAFEPLPVAEHAQILIKQGSTALVNNLSNLFTLGCIGQSHTGLDALSHGLVTTGAAENEEYRGQKLTLAEHVDHIGSI